MAGNSAYHQTLRRQAPASAVATARQEALGAIPAAIPPHPPLVSGGWYRSLAQREVLGPGRYPVDRPARRSAGAALMLTFVFGPVGLCYVSPVAGLIATMATATMLILSGAGFALLFVGWSLAVLWSAIEVSRMHRQLRGGHHHSLG
jgi:hypothetical protein